MDAIELLEICCTRHHSNLLLHRPTLFKYIVSSKIKTLAQLDAAVLFFDNHAPEDFKLNEFEEACGVGKSVWVLLAGIVFISQC
ncbi:hypothetical protein Bca4012_004443 [Brassica carinata]